MRVYKDSHLPIFYRVKMICKISVILFLIGFCVLIDGNNLFADNDDDDESGSELTNAKEELYRRAMTNDEEDFLDKRQSGQNCVSCGWLGLKCCAPNICVKNTLRNKCMKIKG
jgi:hypothetical protein